MKWKGRMGSHLRLFNAFLRLVTGVLGANKAELHPLFVYRHKDRKIDPMPVPQTLLKPSHRVDWGHSNRRCKSISRICVCFCKSESLCFPVWKGSKVVYTRGCVYLWGMVPPWGGSVALCCWQDGCLTAPVAGDWVLVPCMASIPVTMSCLHHPRAHWTSTGVTDDGGWPMSSDWVILSAASFSASSVMDALWRALKYNTYIFTLYAHSPGLPRAAS